MSGVEIYQAQFDRATQLFIRALRRAILSSAPGISEHFKHEIPYYHFNGALCYFSVNREGCISLCFPNTRDFLVDFENVLLKKGGDAVISLHSIKEIEVKGVSNLLRHLHALRIK